MFGSNPKVKDVAVIGVPHEKWGEPVTAVIVLHEGQTATAEEMSGYCKGKIAGFKVPKNVIFIKDEEMPKNGHWQNSPQGVERKIWYVERSYVKTVNSEWQEQ